MTDEKPKPIPWARLVDQHNSKYGSTEEESLASWDRFCEAHPEVKYVVPGKPLHETMPVVCSGRENGRGEVSHNYRTKLAPAQRLWQVGRKVLRRVFRGIR